MDEEGETSEEVEKIGEMQEQQKKEAEQQQVRRRRSPAEFQLPPDLRHQILREECGKNNPDAKAANTVCTDADIQSCMKEVQRTKMRRRSSYAMHEFEHIQVFLESCTRKLRRLSTKCINSKSRAIENDRLMNYDPSGKLKSANEDSGDNTDKTVSLS